MPENNEFRLKFGGYVDQQELKKNVQDAISAINKENSGVGKGVKIPVFNINDIKQQGIKMVEATKDVKKELQNMFSSLGEVKVDSITNMNGQFSQFIATIKNDNQIIDRYVFKLAELQDAEGKAINAFVQMKKTNSDSGLGSVLTKQLGDLEKYKATIDTVLNNHIRVNGEKLLSNGINAKKITDEAVDAIGKIEALKKTAGYNTTEEMKTIKDIVDGLKAEGEEYHRIEKNQKNLIDSQTKEVAAVQNKVTALSNRYIDKTGSNQLFDIKNIEDVNNQIGKIMAKVSELRANTGRSSYDFEANMSVLNNMYDALEKNTKGYYKLETEQRKSSELYQKQDKDVRQYLLDVQKIKDTALNSQSGKRLLDEENIKTVRSELAQAEVILRNILNSHKKGDIVDSKSIDDFVIKMKQVNARISNLSDEETVKIASEKSVQSQLNALNRVEQKVKDVRLTYEDGLLKENNIVTFNASLKEVGDELDKLKAKAGSITEEEMRNLTNLTNKFKTTASILAESEKAQSDFEKRRQSQLNTFAQYSESLKKVQEAYLTSSSPSYLKDNDYSNDIKNRASEIESMLKNFKDNAGSVTDEQIRKYKELSGELDRLASRYANIEKAESTEQKALLKQQYTVEDYVRTLKKYGETTFDVNSRQDFKYNYKYQEIYDDYLRLYDIVDKLQNKSQQGKIIPDQDLSSANAKLKDLTQNISLFDNAEKERSKNLSDYEKQTKFISDLEAKFQSLKDKAFIGGGALKDAFNIEETRKGFKEVSDMIDKLKANRGTSNVLGQGELDAVDIKLKEIGQDISVFRDMESLMSKDQATIEAQTKSLNAYDQKLKDISSKYSRGSNQLFDIKNIKDFEFLVGKAQQEIERLRSNVGNITSDEAIALQNRITDLQRLASERLDAEKAERKSMSDAEKTAQIYESQKYKLAALRQEITKISDSVFKGKNPLVDEENIATAEKKVKSLITFIDNLYTQHGKGNVLPEDAFNRFDLKLKEVSQDLRNMKDDESLQKALAGNVESQTDALNAYDQKLKDIIHKYSTGGNQLFNTDNIKAFNVEVLKIQNELDRLGANVGNISKAESRNLSNMFSELRRTADGYANMEKAERKANEESVKSSKTYEDQAIKLAKLEQSVRTIVDSSLKGGKALIDPNNVDYVEGKLNSINTYINGMLSGHVKGKLIPDEVFARAELRLKELQQDITVFKDEETLIKNATKSMESQLTTLNRFEENIKNLRGNYLMKNGSSELMDVNHIKELETEIGKLRSLIDVMKVSTDTNNEASYRNLTNEYNAVVRLANGFANVEKAQAKNDEALRKQVNTLNDYQRGIKDLYNLNLDPTAQGSLKNATNINNISKAIMQVNTELSHMQAISSSGQLVPTEQMDKFVRMYKDLNSQITFTRRQEGLESTVAKETQSQINKFAEMERSLDSFRSKYYGEGSSTKLSDQLHIDETVAKLQVLDNIMARFKSNAGNVTDNQINTYKDLKNELDLLAQKYANLEAIQNKENQTIEDQKYLLDLYYLDIKKIKETTLNPNSASSLLASDDIQKVIDNFDKFREKYSELRATNNSGSLINKSDLKEADYILKEINQDIKIIGTEMRKEMTADTSIQHMKDQAEVYRQSVIGLVQSLQRQGLYVGELRTEIIGIIKELSQIKVPKDVTAFNLHLSAIEKKIGNVKDALKSTIESEQLQDKLRLLSAQINGYMQQNTRAAILFKSNFENLNKGIHNAKTNADLTKLQTDFKILQQNINNAGKAGQTFGERIGAAVKKFAMWTGMTNSVMYLIRSIKQMITHTKELDSAMVSLKKVTDETDTVYKQIFDNASEKAKELNTSIKDIINSTAEFAKLGFSTNQAQELAEVANVYANVAEIDAETASKTLVSTINGFKELTADNAWDIADIINNISNKFATSGADLGDILQRSSAALSEANNDLNESIALGTVAQTINQDASRVGTALKTLSLRIRGATAQLEKEGLDTEDMVETTADLRRLVLAAAGVDILEKDQKTFKSTYQILLEISKVWENIGDLERASLLQKLGGKMQANIVSSILNNGELLQKVYDESLQSAGSAMQEQERWSESLEAKAGKIEAVFESISAKVMDSESLKSIYDGLAKILDIIDELVGKGKGLSILGGTIGAVFGATGNGAFNKNDFIELFETIKKYNSYGQDAIDNQNKFVSSVSNSNPALGKYLSNLNGAKAGVVEYTGSLIAASAETVALTAVTTALNMIINAGLMIAISALVAGVMKLANASKELQKNFQDASDKIKTNKETLDDYREQVNKIADSEKTETEKIRELNEIKDELSTKYRREIDDIKDVAQARKLLNETLDDETDNERDLYLAENADAYEKALRQLNAARSTNDFERVAGAITSNKSLDIFDDIKDIFENVNSSYVDFGLPGGIGNKSFDIFDYAGDSTDIFEIYDKLTDVYTKFSDIKSLRKDGLTDDEQWLFDQIKSEYNRLKETLTEGDSNLDDVIHTYATKRAEKLVRDHEYVSGSIEEWQEQIVELANGDYYVIQALDEIFNKTEDIVKAEEKTITPFAEILANLSKVAETAKTVHEEIKTADEQFEKLTKTIDDNKDVDKFFSASDIIEILELYPSLNDAILETAYGYKIDEEALESLRDAKLEEKKTALQAQLDEAQGVLDATKTKLEAYKQDLKGVQDVAQAKVRLAELEAKLAQLGANTTNPYYNNSSLEKQIALYKDFIDASEAYEKEQEEIDKLSIELKVLGSDFDEVKDATKDQTDALNAQKDSVKELKDEYDEAKDAIEDLIKLTMDMIKKQKNLEKDALKETLDNFKKLIDKRKELIDLEKEQYEFEKKLKDQNRDLLKLRQELDALSVEGVEYSLEDMKRKAELEQKLVEEEESRTDLLYDHEVDVRKDALDKEKENFEEQINTQIKAIEDYLDKEGRIRQDAIDLINGKSEQFYNDLLNYTMTYTDKSRYEFDKLWTEAYDAILKFAGGELNADLALMNLIASMKNAENELKNIENQINSINHATDAATKAMLEYGRVTSDTKAKMEEATDEAIELAKTVSAINYQTDPRFQKPVGAINYQTDPRFIVSKFHSGGIVEGVSTEHGEVLAKLLSGEVVVTEGQARTFMEKTLPKLAGNSVTNNSSIAPVINMGDINIAGNADQSVVDQIRAVQKDIVNDVFKTINNQKTIFSGTKIR